MAHDTNHGVITRRNLIRGAALAAALPVAAPRFSYAAIAEDDPHNTRIAHRIDARTVTDDDLLFFQQIGLKWARLEFGDGPAPLDYLRDTDRRFARFGIKVFSGVHYSYRSKRVQLGLPGRDQDIETYRQFLRDIGQIGWPVASYDFHPANTYTTKMVQRRGYTAREFDLNDFRAKLDKPAFDREYSADDMWANYTYFIRAVLPAASESGVKLALHPDDPPLAKMNGVAKLFINYDGYHRAEEIAGGSPNWGLTFCVGTWSEGGDKMGRNVFEMIRDFGGRGKIFEAHFRNVTSPLPHFVETFPDDGYMDMYAVMKALREVKFSGAAEPDHVPKLAGDSGILRAGTAYCIASMKTMLHAANEEAG